MHTNSQHTHTHTHTLSLQKFSSYTSRKMDGKTVTRLAPEVVLPGFLQRPVREAARFEAIVGIGEYT